MKNKENLMLLAYSGVPFIMVLGNSMLIPEFPQIKQALHISQFKVGLLITIFSITAGLAIPILGYLSDQYGRIKIIIPSLLLYGSGGLICGTAAIFLNRPYYIILTGRAIQGLGAAGTAPIVMALVGDLYQSNKRSSILGIIESANGVGKVSSPILGSLLGKISWIALFFFYAALALPIAFSVHYFGKEGNIKTNKSFKKYIQNIKKIIQNKGKSLISIILAGMLVLFILFGLLPYFSDLLENKYNIRGLFKGLIIAIPIFFMSIVSYCTGLYLKKINSNFKITINIGLGIIFISLIILGITKNFYIYIIALVLIGMGTGLVLPAVNTLVTSSVSSSQRGIITSLYGSARFIGVALGPPTFSFLQNINILAMYTGGVIITLVVLTITIIFVKEKCMKPTTH